MGIYDREYYRKEGPRYLDALWPTGTVCKWLIGINIVVFIVQMITFPGTQRLDQSFGFFTDAFELNTSEVLSGQVWRLVTYAFLHSPVSVWHIVFNMLFLWWFGSELEQMYGPREFLAFYLVAAVVGGLVYQLEAMVRGVEQYSIGASGAVTAILVLYAFHFPNRLVYLFFVVPVPIWVLVVLQIAQDSFELLGPRQSATAVAVHLGGAAFAFLYYRWHWRLSGWLSSMKRWRLARNHPRLRIYQPEEEPVSVTAKGTPELDEHLDAKLDAVLEKLSRHGRDSLTDSERDILFRASEIYKKKRL